MTTKFYQIKITIILFILSFSTINADELKSVLILTYNNVDKNTNFEYLETSIEDAVREMLKKKFAFAQTPTPWEVSMYADA